MCKCNKMCKNLNNLPERRYNKITTGKDKKKILLDYEIQTLYDFTIFLMDQSI